MKYWLVIGALFLALGCSVAFCQYDETSKDERTAGLGVTNIGNTSATSLTVVLPISQPKLEGWAGGFFQLTTEGDEIISQAANAHIEGGVPIGDFVINGFFDYARDNKRGIAGKTQIGAFVLANIVDTDDATLGIGIGNFVENKSAREDLGFKEADPATVRTLGYVKIAYKGVGGVIRFMPRWDFSDPQAEANPSFVIGVADNLSLVLAGIIGYEAEGWYSSNSLTATLKF